MALAEPRTGSRQRLVRARGSGLRRPAPAGILSLAPPLPRLMRATVSDSRIARRRVHLWVLLLIVPGSVACAASRAASTRLGSEPLGCRDPGARGFDFWAGSWDIRQQLLQSDGTWLELPAATRVYPILGGCALAEEWSGPVQFSWEGMSTPEPMRGYSVRIFDPAATTWSIFWMDSRTRRVDSPYVGGFAGGRGEFFREWTSPAGRRMGRISFESLKPDTVLWELAVSSDGGGTWVAIWTMAMHRRPGG